MRCLLRQADVITCCLFEVVEIGECSGWEAQLRGEAFEDGESDAMRMGGEGFQELCIGSYDWRVGSRR